MHLIFMATPNGCLIEVHVNLKIIFIAMPCYYCNAYIHQGSKEQPPWVICCLLMWKKCFILSPGVH